MSDTGVILTEWEARLMTWLEQDANRELLIPPPKQAHEQPCAECGRWMIKRVSGPCRVIMELEPGGPFKMCGWERNDQRTPTWAHRWHGGYDHLRNGTDGEICLCRHPKHDSWCELCAEQGVWAGSSANHPYVRGTIELDHEARE